MKSKIAQRNKLKNPKGKKFNKGITLIALIITIIVLLILAGVSIATLTSQDGIINKAQKAAEKTEIASEKEQIQLAYGAAETDKIIEDDETNVTDAEMNEELNRQKSKATANGENPMTVTFSDSGRKYDIYQDGNIMELPAKDMSNIYEYNPDSGYIYGIKEEYLEYVEEEYSTNKEIATVKDNIQIAGISRPKVKLAEEVGTYLVVPEEINGTRIVGIKKYTFASIINLEGVKLPNTITTIESCAFDGSKNLRNVSIPSSVTSVDRIAFFQSGLVTVDVPFKEGERPEGWDEEWDIYNVYPTVKIKVNYAK